MAKRKFRVRKGSIKSILLAVLVGALILGSVSGIVAIFNRDTTTVSTFLSFDLGSLDENGIFVKSRTSIYSKDLIECKGLTIEPDFEAKGSFQVFYYDAAKNFLSSTEQLQAEDGIYEMEDDLDLALAKYCRIVITPEPVDEDGKYITDFEIHWYEVSKYAGQFTIKVAKDQTFKYNDLFRKDVNMINLVHFYGMDIEQLLTSTKHGFGAIGRIQVSTIDKLAIICEVDAEAGMYEYFFIDGNDYVIQNGDNGGSIETLVLDVPENAQFFVCNYKIGSEFIITSIA